MTQVQPDDAHTVLHGGFGVAVALDAGQTLELVNSHGNQVIDTWALSRADSSEYLSMAHTRRMLLKLIPERGDTLWSNRRSEMLSIERDTSPGAHDTLFDACDDWLYSHYGCEPGHRNCKDNFRGALAKLGISRESVPAPFNVWMNVSITDNQRLELSGPTSSANDVMWLRALMDIVIVLSACPMDITPVNGPDGRLSDVHYRVIAE
jgi:uncharacterized protein